MLTGVPSIVQHTVHPHKILNSGQTCRPKMLGLGSIYSTSLHSPANVIYGKGFALHELRKRGLANVTSSSGRGVSDVVEDEAAEDMINTIDTSVFEDVFVSVEKVRSDSAPLRSRKLPSPQSTLIPDDWKAVQEYQHRTKKERKQETMDLKLEVARQRAEELRATRKLRALQRAKDAALAIQNERMVLNGESFSFADDVASNENEELDEGEEEIGLQNVIPGFGEPEISRGRAVPKSYRREILLTSLEDIAGSLRNDEAQSEDMDLEKNSDSDLDVAAPAPQQVKFSLTPEEKLLLKRKNMNYSNMSSRSWFPLHTLAASGQVYLAAELLKKGAVIDEVDQDGLTPLHRAVMSGRKTVVRMLLTAGADPLVLDGSGATLLHYSARIGSDDLTKVLLRHGVDVNIADRDGWTPLHVAVQSGRLDLIRALVYRGANILLTNNDGNTALDLALAFGSCFNFYEAIKFLKKRSVLDPPGGFGTPDSDDNSNRA